VIIGIDPGLDGAVARIYSDGRVAVHDTPTLTVKSGPKNKRQYQPREMAELLKVMDEGDPVRLVVIESTHAMPGQGVSSMFSMGYGLGLWVGLVAALGLPYEMVTPQRWKGTMMDGMGKDKDASRFKAQALFPAVHGALARKKDDGRAEALLIAEYARRCRA
jgi:crossover junction endodeoxyribonuclease RuvC